jgi:hypothetical protein
MQNTITLAQQTCEVGRAVVPLYYGKPKCPQSVQFPRDWPLRSPTTTAPSVLVAAVTYFGLRACRVARQRREHGRSAYHMHLIRCQKRGNSLRTTSRTQMVYWKVSQGPDTWNWRTPTWTTVHVHTDGKNGQIRELILCHIRKSIGGISNVRLRSPRTDLHEAGLLPVGPNRNFCSRVLTRYNQ